MMEQHTAALSEPYADEPGTRGGTFYDPQAFADLVAEDIQKPHSLRTLAAQHSSGVRALCGCGGPRCTRSTARPGDKAGRHGYRTLTDPPIFRRARGGRT